VVELNADAGERLGHGVERRLDVGASRLVCASARPREDHREAERNAPTAHQPPHAAVTPTTRIGVETDGIGPSALVFVMNSM
jgi:hypothetical protein